MITFCCITTDLRKAYLNSWQNTANIFKVHFQNLVYWQTFVVQKHLVILNSANKWKTHNCSFTAFSSEFNSLLFSSIVVQPWFVLHFMLSSSGERPCIFNRPLLSPALLSSPMVSLQSFAVSVTLVQNRVSMQSNGYCGCRSNSSNPP